MERLFVEKNQKMIVGLYTTYIVMCVFYNETVRISRINPGKRGLGEKI